VTRPTAQTSGWLAGWAIALAACSHAEAPPPAAPTGPTACERASDSMVGAMLARLPSGDAPTEPADALRNLIRVRCEQDGWSAEATRCLIAMQRLDDAAPCAQLLTEAQQAALVRDEEARFGRAPGRPGEKSGQNSGSARPDSAP
jgi:hypothetical protein